MTVNDMLEQGIEFQGMIEVRRFDPAREGFYTAYLGLAEDADFEADWAFEDVGFIYYAHGSESITVELSMEES